MNFRSLFVDKDKLVMVNMELAMALDSLDEAIVLNQLNYWIERNKNANRNFHDGYYWVYNSYESWKKQDFPVWSTTKIKRIFTSLESKKIVLSANYNKLAIDKTKWYTINFEKLEELIKEYMKCQNETKEDQNEISKDAHGQPIDQNGQTLGQNEIPLPENNNRDYTTENTNKDYRSEITPSDNSLLKNKETENGSSPTGLNTPLSEESRVDARQKKPDSFKWVAVKQHIISAMDKLGYGTTAIETENAIETFRYYYMKYRDKTGQNHPRLNDKTMLSVLNRFISGTEQVIDTDSDTYMTLIDEHFKTNYGQEIDWNIQHFMTEDVRNFLYHRVK